MHNKTESDVMSEILGLNEPWPLIDIIRKLIEASNILLNKKNYDGHGWEEISHAVERGNKIVGLLQLNQKLNSDSTAENKGQQIGMKWVKLSERAPGKRGAENKVKIRSIDPKWSFVDEGFMNYADDPQMIIERGGKLMVTTEYPADYHSSFPKKYIEWLDESPTDKPEELQEKQEEGFMSRMISELPEYGIDTSKWEYLHGDCCYGGAMEFISRCIKGASEPAEELQEEVERLRLVASEYGKLVDQVRQQLKVAVDEIYTLRAALEKVAKWELPPTDEFWDEEKTRPITYEANYGSNGSRDYMKKLAAEALNQK